MKKVQPFEIYSQRAELRLVGEDEIEKLNIYIFGWDSERQYFSIHLPCQQANKDKLADLLIISDTQIDRITEFS